MNFLLKKSMDSLDSLRHFYDIQKRYIDKKSKDGMKKHRMGMLMEYYFTVLTSGTESEKSTKTFLNLEKVIKEYIDVREYNNRRVLYSVKNDNIDFTDIFNSSKEYRKFAEMPVMHGNNTIIMLITRFEEFVADFLRILYEKFPKKYLDKQTITFSEIDNIGIDDIKEKIIEREIDHIMRESYTEWFDLFEEHKMCFDNCSAEYEQLKELYARRNIMVHNSAVVNENYIKNIPNTSHKCGDRLYADDEYINNAFNSIKTMIFCIMIEGIRIVNQDKEAYIDNIFAFAFSELAEKNYSVCKTVFHALKNSKLIDEKTKHMAQVNYWISQIALNGLDSVKEEIEKFDVSALDKTFLIAKLLLLQKNSTATPYIEELYLKNDLPFSAIEQWPLFMGYRNSDEYNKFKNSHPELCGAVESEAPTNIDLNNNDTRIIVKTELNDVQATE